ncbi:HIT family protein, partial [Thiolapillus sp.]
MNRDYSGCPFCHLPQKRILLSNAYGIAIRDAYPVSVGHTLILPHRHVASFFEIKPEERMALLDLLDEARITLDKLNRPEGYNIGINDGITAGQTISHLHIHLIPRYKGDLPDPRGGVRWIFPK